jgi:hypothetical protein
MPCALDALDALELRPIRISEFFYKNEEVQGFTLSLFRFVAVKFDKSLLRH